MLSSGNKLGWKFGRDLLQRRDVVNFAPPTEAEAGTAGEQPTKEYVGQTRQKKCGRVTRKATLYFHALKNQ